MDTVRLRSEIGAVDQLCEELLLLRRRRAGSLTAAELGREMEMLNRAVSSGAKHVLIRKIELLDNDSLLREIGVLKAIMASASQMLSCPGVQGELSEKGFSLENVSLRLHNGLNRVQRLRQALSEHKKLVHGLLSRAKAKNSDLELLERVLHAVNEWEDCLEKEHKTISKVAAMQENHPAHRVAAGIVLPVAAATGLVLGHSDCWA
jgi:hypothetical protein